MKPGKIKLKKQALGKGAKTGKKPELPGMSWPDMTPDNTHGSLELYCSSRELG